MVYEITGTNNVSSLFGKWEETLIWSCLQGIMGKIYADDLNAPTAAMAMIGDFIEIEIDTREEYRRKGFAYVCGAKLILECLKRNLYPSWDAHNKGSVALAEKLGYHYSHSYTAIEIHDY